MMQTARFRIYPAAKQESQLHEMFVVLNRVKRKGYMFWFHGMEFIQGKLLGNKNAESKFRNKYPNNTHVNDFLIEIISLKSQKITVKSLKSLLGKYLQHYLMEILDNNQYVNTLVNMIKTRYEQQLTLLEKRKKRTQKQKEIIQEKIAKILINDRNDRRLRVLYGRLSSISQKLSNLKLKPITFGSKKIFQKRLKGLISNSEFKLRRDSSFACIGRKKDGNKNENLKILKEKILKIHNLKKRTKIWIQVPFKVNKSQEKHFFEILNADMYTVNVIRRLVKGKERYYMHVNYEIPESDLLYNFDDGAIGLDFNYDRISLSNLDKHGELLSYQDIQLKDLNNYQGNKRNNHISFKLDKVINYAKNKRKGIVIENLEFEKEFSYNKRRNRKLNNFKSSALDLLERKCIRAGIAIRKVHPAYTSIIGRYKYSRSRNLCTHTLASYVIARRGLGFKEALPPIYSWVLAQVGGIVKPRLKPSSPYHDWSRIHDLFKQSGMTSYNTAEIIKKVLSMKYVLVTAATRTQPDNLKAGLNPSGQVDDWNKFWNSFKTYKQDMFCKI
ncbi:MAG: IS200/IS605 family accessory protein TnpB-related protein [Candidatus Hodarchaeota archaeon]